MGAIKTYVQNAELGVKQSIRSILEYLAEQTDNLGTPFTDNVGVVQIAEVDITSDEIVGTDAGELGHAQGVELVAAPGAGYFLELISATLLTDFDTAAYTGGGNVSINIGAGGAALTGVVSAANSFGNAASKITNFKPLAAAGMALVANKGLNLVAASAFTDPGTAAGTARVRVIYRVHSA